ncbi:sugar ABC transporter permease [Alkalispirochaeta sphaeroplastigenens]|uniref:Sugar ABC transporter permease n=1 Tax=Alkalispirochaeta sphaeroplastigenens TaxID=1187066 RepID=A0A2S4JH39_9SPIO|nr:sugar ABC transporter permease [Alkalispirochaeta sphaeroplastigenens]POQ98789.1 sugar ABC transporter permease [Alkalispirochaeta sphaeroplastigenens]
MFRERRVPVVPYLLVLPTFTFVMIFTIYPTLASVWGGFFQHRLNVPRFREPQFYGLGNYRDLLESATFRLILGNTVIYVLVLVPLVVTTALLFALWLNKYKGAFFRIAIFHPAILPMVSAATIWLFFFTPGYGIFNQFLRFFGYSGPQNWIANPGMSLWALLIVQFWKDSSFFMIFFLAGVQNLPQDVYEALRLEGAGPLTTFFRFTLPLLRRTSLFVTTVVVIGAFQAVDHVFIMTQGGPSNSSNLLLYHLWQVRFESLNVGRSSAITVLLVLLLLFFTLTNFFASERRTHEV